MLELMEIEDKIAEMNIIIEKLHFMLSRQLNETEERIARLEQEGKLMALYESGLEGSFMVLDIINDYATRLQGSIKEAWSYVKEEREKEAE